MFEFGMVKHVILLLTGPFIEFDCSRYRCSSERFFFLIRNVRKIDGTFRSVWAIHGIRSIQIRGTEVLLYVYLRSQKRELLIFISFFFSHSLRWFSLSSLNPLVFLLPKTEFFWPWMYLMKVILEMLHAH